MRIAWSERLNRYNYHITNKYELLLTVFAKNVLNALRLMCNAEKVTEPYFVLLLHRIQIVIESYDICLTHIHTITFAE